MPTVFAGQWGPEPIISTGGAGVPSAVMSLFLADGTTLAVVYDDRLRSTTISNPMPVGVPVGTAGTDLLGNALFFTDPDDYVLVMTVNTVEVYRSEISVGRDPDEPGGGGGDVNSVNGIGPDGGGNIELGFTDLDDVAVVTQALDGAPIVRDLDGTVRNVTDVTIDPGGTSFLLTDGAFQVRADHTGDSAEADFSVASDLLFVSIVDAGAVNRSELNFGPGELHALASDDSGVTSTDLAVTGAGVTVDGLPVVTELGAPTGAQLLLWNTTSGAWVPVSLSGDATVAQSGALTLAVSGVVAATYGDGSHVAAIVVDAKGRVTAATSVAIQISEGQVTGLTGDLAALIPLTQKGAANGVATLDGTGKLPAGQLPAFAINNVFVVASQAAMLALAANVGDVAVRTDLAPNETFMLTAAPPSTLGNWIQITTPGAVSSVNARTGAVTGLAEQTSLDAETARAELAESGLQTNITNEANTRSSADSTLQTNINSEASTRSTADSGLQTNITNEASTRATADTNEANARIAADAALDLLGLAAFASIAATDTGTGTGLAVSANSTDRILSVTAGVAIVSGNAVPVTAGTVTASANASGNPRIDLVVCSATAVLSIVAGTAAVNPVPPAVPASSALLAQVAVANGATALVPGNVTDRRVVVLNPGPGNVVGPPAKMDRSPRPLRGERAELNQVAAAGQVLCVGDSLVWGMGASGTGALSTLGAPDGVHGWLDRWRQGIAAWRGLPPASLGSVFPWSTEDDVTAHNYPFCLGHTSGAATPFACPGTADPTAGAGGHAVIYASGSSTVLQTANFSYYKCYFTVAPGAGSVQAKIDGVLVGSPVSTAAGAKESGHALIEGTVAGPVNSPHTFQLVFTGGVPSTLDQVYFDNAPAAGATHIVNAGFSGTNIAQFLTGGLHYPGTIQHASVNLPQHIVLCSMLNDFAFGKTPRTWAVDMKRAIDEFHTASPTATFTIVREPRLNTGFVPSVADWNGVWLAACQEVVAYANTVTAGYLFDMYEVLGDLVDTDPYHWVFQGDTTHPNGEAYTAVGGEAMRQHVPGRGVAATTRSDVGGQVAVPEWNWLGTGGQVFSIGESAGVLSTTIHASITDYLAAKALIADASILGTGFRGVGRTTAGVDAYFAAGGANGQAKFTANDFTTLAKITVADPVANSDVSTFSVVKEYGKGGYSYDLMPTGAKMESKGLSRVFAVANVALIVSGTLFVVACEGFRGDTISSSTWYSRTTALSGPSHMWAVLLDSSRIVRAVTTDDVAGTWGASSSKTFSYAAPYLLPSTGLYYIGIMIAATQVPTLGGIANASTLTTAPAPVPQGTSSTAQTTPPAIGATMGALTSSGGTGFTYAYAS